MKRHARYWVPLAIGALLLAVAMLWPDAPASVAAPGSGAATDATAAEREGARPGGRPPATGDEGEAAPGPGRSGAAGSGSGDGSARPSLRLSAARRGLARVDQNVADLTQKAEEAARRGDDAQAKLMRRRVELLQVRRRTLEQELGAAERAERP